MNRLGAWSLKRVGGRLISVIGLVVGSRTRHRGVLGSIPATARDDTLVLTRYETWFEVDPSQTEPSVEPSWLVTLTKLITRYSP